MKKSLSIFNSHNVAVRALEVLRGYRSVDMSKISLVGKEEIVEDHIKVKSNKNLIYTLFATGAVLGTTLGLLTGIGLFTIPGFDVFYNTGILIGSLVGFQFGVAIGGLIAIVVELFVKEKRIVYDHHTHSGRFHMVAEGTEEEIKRIENIVNSKYFELAIS